MALGAIVLVVSLVSPTWSWQVFLGRRDEITAEFSTAITLTLKLSGNCQCAL